LNHDEFSNDSGSDADNEASNKRDRDESDSADDNLELYKYLYDLIQKY